MAAIPCIPESEKEFLALNGNFTESVRVTFPGEMGEGRQPFLSGFYVFERTLDTNLFVRQTPAMLIQMISCATKYIQFDKDKGALPNRHYYTYRALCPRSRAEYEAMKNRLSAIGEWRQMDAAELARIS